MSNEDASDIQFRPAAEIRRGPATHRWLLPHTLAYTIAVAVNTIVDVADRGGWRVHWLALGWGIGLTSHAALVIAGVLQNRNQTSWRPGAERTPATERTFEPPAWPEEHRP